MMPVLLSICICSVLRGGDANECVTQGKSYMFNGTLSGIRQAYQTFDDCLKGIGCTNCSGSRELKFLHSLTGTAMLLIRDDGGSVSSVLELRKIWPEAKRRFRKLRRAQYKLSNQCSRFLSDSTECAGCQRNPKYN